MPKLNDWSVVMMEKFDPYKAPELYNACLHGVVESHDREEIVDGKPIKTSKIKYLDPVLRKAKTKNTEYDLGEPSKEWVTWLEANGYKVEDYKKVD